VPLAIARHGLLPAGFKKPSAHTFPVIAGLALYVSFILWARVRLFGGSPLG
jgi:hypothetical protein